MSPIGIIYSEYDMDSGYVYAKFITGDIVLIDCDEIEKTYANNMYERSELDYAFSLFFYNKIIGVEIPKGFCVGALQVGF